MEIRRSLPPSKKNPTARAHSRSSVLLLLWRGAAAMKMRDRGEYERKNPSPLIQQQFLSQSNFADCPVNREEEDHFLCLLNQVGPKIKEGDASFFACRWFVGSIPKSQFDTFGDFIFTVICEQWQAQWTDGRRLLPFLHLLR